MTGTQPGWRLLLAMTVAIGAIGAGCGASSDDARVGAGGASTPGSIPREADGTVPWVDLPAPDDAFNLAVPAPPEVGEGAGPCTADQLEGTLPEWYPKGDNDEGRPRTPANGLIGMVAVRNTSDQDCTLQGEVEVSMTSAGRSLELSTSHAINDEARGRVTPVPAGRGASLRLDWDPPFCMDELPEQVIELQLPDDGGVLRVPALDPSQPACTDAGSPPDRSWLSSSGFDAERSPTALDSPFNSVTVAIEAPEGPVPVGSELTFHVVLTNPTPAPIAFDPLPGFFTELFSMSDGSNEPVNTSKVMFLNHLTVDELVPGATRFEMVIPLPDELGAGRDAIVSWRLMHPALVSADRHAAAFEFRTSP